jgi:hypothetical protein
MAYSAGNSTAELAEGVEEKTSAAEGVAVTPSSGQFVPVSTRISV